MSIHDEILLQTVYKLKQIVGQTKPEFILMHTQYVLLSHEANEWQRICPDISVYPKDGVPIVIEVESDASYDFDKSIRQIKNYSTENTRLYGKKIVILPIFYEKFAELYLYENIGVFIWSAKREWTCLRCGHKQTDERMVKPNKCVECNTNELKLSGLIDFKLVERRDFKPIEHE